MTRHHGRRPAAHTAACLALLACTAAAMPVHAEVYKWVDEKGQTHYGERKPDSRPGGVSEVKIKTAPISPQAATPPQAPTEDWLRPPKPVTQAPVRPSREQIKPSRTNGRENGTDASRCDLARDVLDGNLRHGNGSPIDKHDIDTAKNDVKLFCKNR